MTVDVGNNIAHLGMALVLLAIFVYFIRMLFR